MKKPIIENRLMNSQVLGLTSFAYDWFLNESSLTKDVTSTFLRETRAICILQRIS